MFGMFNSNPTKKMRKQYNALLEKAMVAQRNGDMKSYAKIREESETLWSEIQAIEKGAK